MKPFGVSISPSKLIFPGALLPINFSGFQQTIEMVFKLMNYKKVYWRVGAVIFGNGGL